MKKPYIAPELELISVCITTNILFHSDFEAGGKNTNWDWNDKDWTNGDIPSDVEDFP